MLKVGKLYSCEDYFLILYPDKESAHCAWTYNSPATASSIDDAASKIASRWSTTLRKSVSYTEKNIPLLILNNEKKYIEVLAEDKKGWIINAKWLNLKEIE